MGPLAHPTNRDYFTAYPSGCQERFPGICRRTHGRNGLKFCMLMYPDHHDWPDYGYSLLIFIILVIFWLFFQAFGRALDGGIFPMLCVEFCLVVSVLETVTCVISRSGCIKLCTTPGLPHHDHRWRKVMFFMLCVVFYGIPKQSGCVDVLLDHVQTLTTWSTLQLWNVQLPWQQNKICGKVMKCHWIN